MKKLTRGKYAQFLPPIPAKTEVNRKGRTVVLKPARRGKYIIHSRSRTDKKMEAKIRDSITFVGFVRWQDTEGARRRGWK